MNAEEREVLARYHARKNQTAPVKRGLSIPDLCAGVLVVVGGVVIVVLALNLAGVL